jgi:signal transduction histidine kinase
MGTVTFASPAFLRMSGLSEPEVLGADEPTFSRRLAAVCADEAAFPGLDTLRTQWLAAGDGRPPRQLIRLAGGAQRVLEVGLRESVGGEVQRLLFFRDVTHETEVDRMKSEFLSHAAHELRTPMASIYGFAELLRTRRMSEEKRQELLDIIHRQAEAMTAIIDELLDLARIDDRRGKDFVFAPVDAAALLREAVASFKTPEGRDVPTLDLPEGLPPLRADASKLEQAVRNLLSNAYKYSPQGGAVEVRLLDGGDGRLGLQVRDHGLGMSPEQVARVFERFYRADTSGNIPGTGLGMSIVQEIASLHQGEAVVDSALGEGTTVTLWLPTVAALRG